MVDERKNRTEREAENNQPETDVDAGQTEEAAESLESASLEEQLAATRHERDESRDRFLRAQAELENYRRRTQRELAEERRYAALPIVRDLLPVIDNFQRALDAARNSERAADLIEGLEMVIRQLEETLSRHGTTPIAADGEPFDPNLHEAVQQRPSADRPPMTVLQELERGYVLHDRVVRPSKVIVSTAPPAAAENTESGDSSTP
jgi:molecular chaperone GrpE